MDLDFNEIMHLTEIAGAWKMPTIFRESVSVRAKKQNK